MSTTASTPYTMSNAITLDHDNNLLIAGEFEGTVDFDPGVGTSNRTSSGTSDAYVTKLDTSGNFIWVQTLDGSSIVDCYDIAIDKMNNIYLTGRFFATVDFDPGAGTSLISATLGSCDIYVIKLDSAGNLTWVNCFGGDDDDYGEGIAVDENMNVYTTGRFQLSADFDPGTGISMQTSIGAQDVFIQKVDSLGALKWVKTFGGSSSDYGKSLMLDTLANIYLCGYFKDSIDLDPSTNIDPFQSNGMSDIFFEKLDSSGNYIWGTAIGGPYSNAATDIALDNNNYVYLTGYFDISTDFDPEMEIYLLENPTDRSSFIAKYKEGYSSIPELETNEYNFQIYPNPSTGTQTLIVNVDQPIDANIRLIDINGQILQNVYNGPLLEGQRTFYVDVSDLPAGLYIYTILLGDEKPHYLKIVKL